MEDGGLSLHGDCCSTRYLTFHDKSTLPIHEGEECQQGIGHLCRASDSTLRFDEAEVKFDQG